MMLIKSMLAGLTIAAAMGLGSAVQADALNPDDSVLLAYWNQNSNDLSGGGFGFEEGDFPQAPDAGDQLSTAVLMVGGGNITATDDDGVYTRIPSFAGTTTHALFDDPAGGSIAFQGGTDTENNGTWLQFEFSMAGFEGLVLSFATQGTSTGFDNNQVSYSVDGTTFTDLGSSYAPASIWAVEEFDFGNLLDGADIAIVRITLDGATSTSGNNRFDNIQLNATFVPEPASLALLGAGGVLMLLRRGGAAQA